LTSCSVTCTIYRKVEKSRKQEKKMDDRQARNKKTLGGKTAEGWPNRHGSSSRPRRPPFCSKAPDALDGNSVWITERKTSSALATSSRNLPDPRNVTLGIHLLTAEEIEDVFEKRRKISKPV